MAKKETKQIVDFPFGKENYFWTLVGLAFIFLGFILMSGGGSDDPAVWDESIFSPVRITVAPILVILGFIIEVYAITKKSRD